MIDVVAAIWRRQTFHLLSSSEAFLSINSRCRPLIYNT